MSPLTAHCQTEAPLHCQNEGFIGKDCTCICKPGYIGELCQTFDEGSAGEYRDAFDFSDFANSIATSTATAMYKKNKKNMTMAIWPYNRWFQPQR